jgi:hypothetical protein
LTPRALAAGAERAQVLKAAHPWWGKISQAQIAKNIGVTDAMLCRLKKQFGHLALEELTPENLAYETGNCGKAGDWADFARQPEVIKAVKHLYYLTVSASCDQAGKSRRSGSMALAMERFAEDPLCHPHPVLQEMLRRGKIPACFLRILRRITPEMEQRHRGAKHQSLNGSLIQRRNNKMILEDGTEFDLAPGDWWVFDDMSDNQRFWFLGPDGQPMIGRQGLYAYDVCHHWLGCELVGTSRDSYTAAIILRFIRRLMQTYGKPRHGIVFEQSVWKAASIAGYRRTPQGDFVESEMERPAMSVDDVKFIQDGLKSIGIRVHYTYTPRGKEIEGAFNYLQRVAAVASPEHINGGRHAGEFEQAAKAERRAHAGSHHPAGLGFAEMGARADKLAEVMEWINRRREFKNPEYGRQNSEQETAGYPALAPLTRNDLQAFLPRLHKLIQVRGLKATVTCDGAQYDFADPEGSHLFASLGAGYRIALKFDPGEPSLGAAIYNMETSTANHHGWQRGQFIGMAAFLPQVPRFDFRAKAERDNTASDMKRAAAGFVRTEYRAAGLNQFRASTARDGKGNVLVRTQPGRASETLALPAPQPRSNEPNAEQLRSRRRLLAEGAEIARNIKEMFSQ